jgi:fructoselysine-6-P-deglycase FrlB-like protein
MTIDSSSTRGQYAHELENLRITYQVALDASTNGLKSAITAASQSSLIGVGSGGSFTVASLLCNLHETFTGRVSRPATPLEIICNPTLASTSPAFFVSAEGKNPDIVEALIRARQRSARPIHVITNRTETPLTEAVNRLRDVTLHVFPLQEKDGYLATNSLLLDSMVVARAFGELHSTANSFPTDFSGLSVNGASISDWEPAADEFAELCNSRQSLIIIFAPALRPIAADLESKLAESALMHVQLADLRSFAHGRHLWLSERAKDCAILALVDAPLLRLWAHMQSMISNDIPTLRLGVESKAASGMVSALVAGMKLVELVAKWRNFDPGRPVVAPFGRALYYADIAKLVPVIERISEYGEEEKFSVLGAHWPHILNRSAMRRARQAHQEQISAQRYRAVVFDYDGTLRTTQQEDAPPSELIVEHLLRLTRSGIVVAIVSGRGESLRLRLREVIPEKDWNAFHLGLYNGGWIGTLSDGVDPNGGTSELLNHVSRIAHKLKVVGVPILTVKSTPPYQVSIRFLEGVDTEAMWFVVGDALRHAGLELSGMVRSRHSIDVLAPGTSKSHLIAKLIYQYRLLPHELLAIGDQGAWPGNDAALLEHKRSLSVDLPSRRLDRGWKLAPPEKRGVDATLWYLERMVIEDGSFSISFNS